MSVEIGVVVVALLLFVLLERMGNVYDIDERGPGSPMTSKQFVKFWRDFLQDYGEIPTICIENVMDTEPQRLADAVAEVGDERLRLCLDVGHANLTPAPMDEWLDAFLPQLAHVHLHNNVGKTDEHRALFDGTLDMPSIFKVLLIFAPFRHSVSEIHRLGRGWGCRRVRRVSGI